MLARAQRGGLANAKEEEEEEEACAQRKRAKRKERHRASDNAGRRLLLRGVGVASLFLSLSRGVLKQPQVVGHVFLLRIARSLACSPRVVVVVAGIYGVGRPADASRLSFCPGGTRATRICGDIYVYVGTCVYVQGDSADEREEKVEPCVRLD